MQGLDTYKSRSKSGWGHPGLVRVSSLASGTWFETIDGKMHRKHSWLNDSDNSGVIVSRDEDGTPNYHIRNAIVLPYEFEDRLNVSEAEYDERFPESRIVCGVRMFPMRWTDKGAP